MNYQQKIIKALKALAEKENWQDYAEDFGENINNNFNFDDYLWEFDPKYPLAKFPIKTRISLKEMYLSDKEEWDGHRYSSKWEKEIVKEEDRQPIVLVEENGKVADLDGGGILDGNHRVGLYVMLKRSTIPAVVGKRPIK